MAKGDRSRVQNQNQFQGDTSQNWLNNTRNNLIPQNQDLQNRNQVALDRADRDYSNMQGGLNDYIGKAYDYGSYGAYPMYQQFAKTGGFSPEDIAAMRARGEGAVRSTFDSARRNLEQQNRIMGGSSNARTAALAKVARDTAHEVGDTDINLEAQLADSIRQGKLAGMSGMTSIDQARLQNALAGMSGMRELYASTPGIANMTGNQLSESNRQMINMQDLQQKLSEMIMNGQLNLAKVPGNFQQAMGNIGSVLNLGSKFFGLPNLFSGSGMYNSPSASYEPNDYNGVG